LQGRGLSERLYQLETCRSIDAVFWKDLLQRANATSKTLQDPKLDLKSVSAVALVRSLKTSIESKRNCFQEYEKEWIEKSGTADYIQKRERQRNVRLDPLDQPSHTIKFRIGLQNFLPVIHQFVTALQHRLGAYELVSSRFGFLRKLNVLWSQELQAAHQICWFELFKDDLYECFGDELVQFVDFVERSFSKMKLIKNRLRTSMGNEMLSHLAVMSTEADLLLEINFDDLVTECAKKKTRKVSLISHDLITKKN
jgi:hypothetical protein